MPIRRILALRVLLVSVAALAPAPATAPPLETVPHADLTRYIGRWYEIARYPNWFERKCDHNVTADYSTKPTGQIRIVNACITKTGATDQSTGSAKIADPSTNAKLKVTFVWPFYGDYWIIALGDNYDYAVVGDPSRDYLWILSRTPTLPDALYQSILAALPAKGYDAQRLVKTTQSAPATP
jgi:apolipoprotein D and lipocalin family protein